MKYLVVMFILIFIIACEQGPQQISSLDNAQDSISYSIGTDIGKNLNFMTMKNGNSMSIPSNSPDSLPLRH